MPAVRRIFETRFGREPHARAETSLPPLPTVWPCARPSRCVRVPRKVDVVAAESSPSPLRVAFCGLFEC